MLRVRRGRHGARAFYLAAFGWPADVDTPVADPDGNVLALARSSSA